MTSAEPIPGSKRDKARRAAPAHVPERFRMLPASDIAERGVICSFLLAPKEVGGLCVEKQIRPESFHSPAFGVIFAALMEMWDKGRPIDVVILTQELADRGLLEQVGGAALVSELFTYLPTATNVAHYNGIVRAKSLARQVITCCTQYASRAYEESDEEEIETLLGELEAAVLGIAAGRAQEGAVSMKQAVMGAISGIQTIYERRGAVSGLETGFKELDKMTDGLHAGEMIVIAARPSMGKTAFAMNIAEHVAVDLGKPVAVFSLEMSQEQLVQRLLCSRAKVNLARVRDGFLSERDFPALTAAASQLGGAQMWIDDASSLTILELKARARRLKQQHDIAAIFVDYLQLLRSGSKRAQENRQIEVSEISSGLKALAKELRLPVVVLAQLNRKADERTGDAKGRPRLGDLRESGSIEQDADVVGLLVREEYYAESDAQKEESVGKATLIIAKQRNGPVGDVPLTFRKEFTRFENRAEEP